MILERFVRSSHLMSAVETILVQFHRNYEIPEKSHEKERCRLLGLLKNAGWCPFFSFPYIWEAWTNPKNCGL